MASYSPPLVRAPCNGLPILLSVPHSGRDYDQATLARSCQGRPALEALEDPFVDRLLWRAVAAGFGAVIQPTPRAIIDCNRAEDEVDPAAIRGVSPLPVGLRARRGLGIVPSRTQKHGTLWRAPIDRPEFMERLRQVHRPFHRAIEAALDRLSIEHGVAVLIDCHSMPARRRGQAAVVIGDRNGTSAAPWVTFQAAEIVRRHGYGVAINDPYAGGHVTERHGRPSHGIHAIQIEIDRSAYLNGDGRTAAPAFDHVASLVAGLAEGLGHEAVRRNGRQAAE